MTQLIKVTKDDKLIARITHFEREKAIDAYRSVWPHDTLPRLETADLLTREDSTKQRIFEYQAAWLFALTRQYNGIGNHMLDIGVYYGYTTAVMAMAAPCANILSLGIHEWEINRARENLSKFHNVNVNKIASWDLLETYSEPELSLVWIDGDHKEINRDLAWWNWVKVGGLMLMHDYSPNGSARACPPVYRGARRFVDFLHREPDVLIIDEDQVGMCGWYKYPIDENKLWKEVDRQ